MIITEYYGPQTNPESNEIMGDFVSEVIWGEKGKIENYCSMAVIRDGNLIAGTLYHNWHPDAGVIELSSAAIKKRWLTDNVIRAMFHLPFERLGCQLVVLRVSERNVVMCKTARHFGFTEVYIPRLRSRDEGEFIFSYTDDQWRASRYYGEVS